MKYLFDALMALIGCAVVSAIGYFLFGEKITYIQIMTLYLLYSILFKTKDK